MQTEVNKEIELEIAYVLFIDIVGYSKLVTAEDLEQYGHWKRHLHDLGECEVKHGVRVSVVNLYTENLGNPEVPQKFRQARKGAAPVIREKSGRGKSWIIAAGLIVLAALTIGGLLLMRR